MRKVVYKNDCILRQALPLSIFHSQTLDAQRTCTCFFKILDDILFNLKFLVFIFWLWFTRVIKLCNKKWHWKLLISIARTGQHIVTENRPQNGKEILVLWMIRSIGRFNNYLNLFLNGPLPPSGSTVDSGRWNADLCGLSVLREPDSRFRLTYFYDLRERKLLIHISELNKKRGASRWEMPCSCSAALFSWSSQKHIVQ